MNSKSWPFGKIEEDTSKRIDESHKYYIKQKKLDYSLVSEKLSLKTRKTNQWWWKSR